LKAKQHGNVTILDTTLRDGSYTIDFKFTASDTSIIAEELEAAGCTMIEIGHGVGLGASEAGHGQAAETDEDYLKAAAQSVKKAKWGMFCIPGIATLEHVDMAAEHGMSFLRVGTDVTAVRKSEPFIARAKKHGMFVSSNFMKSYATSPMEFAKHAKLSHEFGSDLLCVVDSAGGMLPNDVEAYFTATRDQCGIALGFHGHNNLGLAVAHTLRAVELGAAVVDTSLQGMGRSAGNAPTEMVLAALDRMGYSTGMDTLYAMDVGEKYIRPLIRSHGIRSLDIVCGQAQFHSSYMSVIRKFSSQYRIDPRKLIMAVTEVDKVNAPTELVESIAKRIRAESEVFTARFDFDEYVGDEQRPRR